MHTNMNRWILLLCGVLLASVQVSDAAANLRNRDAWRVLIPHEDVERALAWGDLIAGTDDGGGLYLFDPAAGTLESVTTREGLTSNRTSDLALADDGVLWVATLGGGIVRVDAARTARSVTGLLDLAVTAIAIDGEFVYYGTEVGGGRIVSGLPEFTFTEDDGLVSNRVRALAAYDGLAWFGTDAGISEFSRARNTFETRNDGLTFTSLTIHDLLADADGVVAATGGGVFAYDPADSTWSPVATGLDADVRRIARTGNGLHAVTASSRVFRWTPPAAGWEELTLDSGAVELASVAEGSDGTIWFGGSLRDPSRNGVQVAATFWRPGEAATSLQGLHGSQARGLYADGDGGVWVGTFPVRSGVTRWQADGSPNPYNLVGDGVGWCSANAQLAVFQTSSGDVWTSAFGNCVTRMVPAASDDPAEATYESFDPTNSPLRSTRVIRIAEDPQGRIWFLSDGGGNDPTLNRGLDILVDPTQPYQPASWIKADLANSGLEGNNLKGVTFGEGGVAWISVTGAGVQRWDYDGFGNDGVIRTVDQDGFWSTISGVDLGVSLANARGVEIAANGDLWVATNDQGVVRFRWNSGVVNLVTRVQVSTFGPTLLSNQVRTLLLDREDNLWCATDAGLNRVRGEGQELAVDSWTDFAAFDNRNLGQSFLPDIISPLPGSNVQTLAYDAQAHRLFLGTQTGAARLDLGAIATAAPTGFEATLYPNPVRELDQVVRATGFEGSVDVEIYSLLGVPIATKAGVESGGQIWDTLDLSGSPVAPGMYLVRLQRDSGESIRRVLAVER